jgi:hypothetical protein
MIKFLDITNRANFIRGQHFGNYTVHPQVEDLLGWFQLIELVPISRFELSACLNNMKCKALTAGNLLACDAAQ